MGNDPSAQPLSAGRSQSCACAAVRRASRSICHLYDLVLAPTRLKATQFIVLQTIAEVGEIAHCDLARQLAASEETFSRRLALARKNGWVSMRTGDRQTRLYRLTEHGRQVLDKAMPSWERAQQRLRQELDLLDWQSLAGFADRLTQAALRAETAPAKNGRPQSPPLRASAPAGQAAQLSPAPLPAGSPSALPTHFHNDGVNGCLTRNPEIRSPGASPLRIALSPAAPRVP